MCSIRRDGVRVLSLVFAIAWLVSGCVSSPSTLAQDLAWKRWQKCDSFRTVALKEIKTDGQIWVWAQDQSDLFAWQECDRRAQAAQARSGVTLSLLPSAASPVRVVPPPAAASRPPVWRPSDEWAFRWESPAGTGTFVWSVDREEAIEGILHYVIKTGAREIFYRQSDIAMTRETVDGIPVLLNAPPRLRYVWPLQVGKTWEQTLQEDRPLTHATAERVDIATVEDEEWVAVPAGVFKTFKIVYRDKGTGDIRYEEWYSPHVKHPVMFRERLASGLRVRELIAFKLR